MQPKGPMPPSPPLTWDVFCRVIDNLGDIGVCWRLCADLAARGHRVRLWVDDAAALRWMAPGALEGQWPGVQVLPWEQSQDASTLATLAPADVWIEGFGCEVATEFIATYARLTEASGQNHHQAPVWINLEYLSAEPYVERCHGLPSPVLSGPGKGWIKHFYYPGFTAATGGLLREPDLLERQQTFVQNGQMVPWLARHGITWTGERLVSLFCYEPVALPALLAQLDALPTPTLLLVTPGRATSAVQAAVQAAARAAQDGGWRNLRIAYLPALTQFDYDHLLWACDLNFVRGEDSLVRALWAGKPLVWQIYPQQDAAHVQKLDAFLDAMGASASLRAFHHAWNGTPHGSAQSAAPRELPLIDLNSWFRTVQSARERLLKMDDLVTQLLHFVWKKR